VFARQTTRGIVCGVGRAETLLEGSNFGEVEALVRRIVKHRKPNAADKRHPLYRCYPERWMQSVVCREIEKIGYDLAPEQICEQVAAVCGVERGQIDLLAATRGGRLVVMELKASEEIQLPMQALDYWMRVERHQRCGELEQLGYFEGQALSPQQPLLLLVSPALQFHPACETILHYVSPEVEVVRIGVNEGWREGLQVVSRTGRA
jgi:hypothetical protein